MGNLTITNTIISKEAEKILTGNTAVFNWTTVNEEPLNAINFQVKRGKVGDENYTGNNEITGAYYPESGKFDVQNNLFMEGDFQLYQLLLTELKAISDNI